MTCRGTLSENGCGCLATALSVCQGVRVILRIKVMVLFSLYSRSNIKFTSMGFLIDDGRSLYKIPSSSRLLVSRCMCHIAIEGSLSLIERRSRLVYGSSIISTSFIFIAPAWLATIVFYSIERPIIIVCDHPNRVSSSSFEALSALPSAPLRQLRGARTIKQITDSWA